VELVQHNATCRLQGQKAQGDLVCKHRDSGLWRRGSLTALAGGRRGGDVEALGGVAMSDCVQKISAIGSVSLDLCCFTPALVWPLAGLGLAGLFGRLDLDMLPVSVTFFIVTGYAPWQRCKNT
jgi:hypothetical protein